MTGPWEGGGEGLTCDTVELGSRYRAPESHSTPPISV